MIGMFNSTDGKMKLKYAAVMAESPLQFFGFQTFGTLKDEYEKWQTLMGKVNKDRPASIQPVFQTAHGSDRPKWVWMRTQEVFVTSALTGTVAGTCLAFLVILFATRSPVMAVFAGLTIACIILCVLGTMDLLGWELGTIESICLTIVAGFSVDYVVHLAHAYTHSTSALRAERVRDALGEMGISVLSGMATSVLASVPLFLCIIMTFNKFGSFLCMTVVFSWVWANFGFMGLCAQFGPQSVTQKFDKTNKGAPNTPDSKSSPPATEAEVELNEEVAVQNNERTV